MNPFSMNFVAEFAELLTTALIHFVWQGAVLTLILLVTVKLLDVRTARLRSKPISTARLGPSPSARTFRTRTACCVMVRLAPC